MVDGGPRPSVESRGRSFVFCTSYVKGEQDWQARYQRWIDHHLAVPFGQAATILIDDASPFPPGDPRVVRFAELPDRLDSPAGLYMLSFAQRLGRGDLLTYPGWWRSFLASVRIARKYDMDRIIHVESDAYVLSERLAAYLASVDSGWVALWCAKHGFPETGIQVIARDCYERMEQLDMRLRDNPNLLDGKFAEYILPFTHIERGFAGNRYGDSRIVIPGFAEFACQVKPYQRLQRG